MSSVARRLGFLMQRVEHVGDCWMWTGELRDGYGYVGGRRAYKLMYELLVGAVPSGLELDHTCRNTWCVFPDHLEPVTRAENQRRRAVLITACNKGHEFTPENTYRTPGSSSRRCRACQREACRRYRESKVQ